MRYLIPFSYMLSTRYKTMAYKCAFLLVYLVPLLIISFLDKADMRLFVFSVMGINCVYENGYIDNDMITTQWEDKPTIRASTHRQERFNRQYLLMRAFRDMGFVVFGLSIGRISLKTAWIYFVSVSLLIVVYSFHNTIRSIWNILTFSLLLALKYAVPILCICDKTARLIWNFLSLWVVICIPRIVEYALKYRRDGEVFIESLDRNRFIYYIFVAVVAVSFYSFYNDALVFMVLAVYYLLFRGTAYLLKERKKRWKQMEEEKK